MANLHVFDFCLCMLADHQRLGILMLYDDSEQLEVRHVISLAHYDVDIYAGGERIPEGELWIKRNCIRLTQRQSSEKAPSDAKPFYLFSDNCSEKEDFYHAILASQDHRTESHGTPPRPLKFNTPDLVRLVQQLHASEENLHTRWINALIGRVFLALYKTDDVEKFIWTKITKKIARVPKPALISKINLQKVDMGVLPPFITNPKLRELTVDGDMMVEADVSYKGNFRVEISAIARIDLGTRFKAREVTLVLATTLKKLEGHILLRMKPPPSNRLWVTFESAPKMELAVEPIVSSRQITYGVILRAIESRLREVVSETLVLPNWDDFPFKDTERSDYRGGIWTGDAKKDAQKDPLDELAEEEEIAHGDKSSESEESEAQVLTPASTDGTRSIRTTASSTFDSVDSSKMGFSSATDIKPNTKPRAIRSGSFANISSPIVNIHAEHASADKHESREGKQDAAGIMQAISRSQPTSPAETPVGSPSQPSHMESVGKRRSTSPAGFRADHGREEDPGSLPVAIQGSVTLPNLSSSAESSSPASSISRNKSKHGSSLSLPRNTFATNDKRQVFNQSLNNATAAAKKWFATKQPPASPSSPYSNPRGASSQEHTPHLPPRPSDDPSHDNSKGSQSNLHTTLTTPTTEKDAPLGSPANPIGRGQPIPEIGLSSSKPEKKTGWSVPAASTFANLTKRKPVAANPPQSPQPSIDTYNHTPSEDNPPPLPSRTGAMAQAMNRPGHQRKASVGTAAMGGSKGRKNSYVHPAPSPVLGTGRRQRRSVTGSINKDAGDKGEGMLVVEAPPMDVSVPNSPAKPEHRDSKGSIETGEASARSGRESVETGRKGVYVDTERERESTTPDEGLVFPVEVDDEVA